MPRFAPILAVCLLCGCRSFRTADTLAPTSPSPRHTLAAARPVPAVADRKGRQAKHSHPLQHALPLASAAPLHTRLIPAAGAVDPNVPVHNAISAAFGTIDALAPVFNNLAPAADTLDTSIPVLNGLAAAAGTIDTVAPALNNLATADTVDTATPIFNGLAPAAATVDTTAPVLNKLTPAAGVIDASAPLLSSLTTATGALSLDPFLAMQDVDLWRDGPLGTLKRDARSALKRGDLATYSDICNQYFRALDLALNRRSALSANPIPPRRK